MLRSAQALPCYTAVRPQATPVPFLEESERNPRGTREEPERNRAGCTASSQHSPTGCSRPPLEAQRRQIGRALSCGARRASGRVDARHAQLLHLRDVPCTPHPRSLSPFQRPSPAAVAAAPRASPSAPPPPRRSPRALPSDAALIPVTAVDQVAALNQRWQQQRLLGKP